MTAFRQRVRPRDEEGFTLVELLIAMIVLTVGILALVAAYTSGYVALNRATRVSSTELIADSQMERFRALNYSNIQLDLTCGSSCTQSSTYTSDAAYSATAQISGCGGTPDATCLSTQTKTGPDGKSYRLDTFIDCETNSSGTFALTTASACAAGGASVVKLVTVVVTSIGGTGLGATSPVSTREQSTFTSITGS